MIPLKTSLFTVALATLVLGQLQGADWFVAPAGNDAWSGSLPAPNSTKTDGPFASLKRARDAVRARRKAGAAPEKQTVHVRAGTYLLSEPFKLEAQDSGTADAPMIYRAYEKEQPLLIGGRAITGWDPEKDQILKADLQKQGFKKPAFKQLLFGGTRQPLARYPNADSENPYGGGFAYADGENIPMYKDIEGEPKNILRPQPADIRSWSHPEEVELFIFPRFNWWNNVVALKAVDNEKRHITTATDCSYPIRKGDRYFFQNALEELDAPGEWYLDPRTATAYFWPPTPLDDQPVWVPTLKTLVELEPGTAHVTLRGLRLECCEGNAIQLRNTERCLIVGNTLRNVCGFSGIAIAIHGGRENGAVGNDISQVGSNGISLSGGELKTLTPAGNYAENNYIHHFGVFFKQGVGIALSGVGNRATRNLIHDGPRFGIIHGGSKNLIELNRIRHVCLETEDTGAIYSNGRDWLTPRGTVIRHNFISDIWGYGRHGDKWQSPYFAWGIYLDDNSGGADVFGNIIARCSRSGIHGHSARDCRIENNIFFENGLSQIEFTGWTTEHRFWKSHFPSMVRGYESVSEEPAWKLMRGISLHPRDSPLPNGLLVRGNSFERNLMVYSNTASKALAVRNIPFEVNRFDYNLYWAAQAPLLTGYQSPGKALSNNLLPESEFEEVPGETLPKAWIWQNRPSTEAEAAGFTEGSVPGRRALRIAAALQPDKPSPNYPVIASREFPLKAERNYRLRARMRSSEPDSRAGLQIQGFIAPKDGKPGHFWASFPAETAIGTEWKDVDLTVRIPAPTEKGGHAEMTRFRVRIQFPSERGFLFVESPQLHEVEALDEWQSWVAQGNDTHSKVADPHFLNAPRDDFRLAADSPAWALGFEPIPVERIGPYEDPLRATWPISEEKGAREKALR